MYNNTTSLANKIEIKTYYMYILLYYDTTYFLY